MPASLTSFRKWPRSGRGRAMSRCVIGLWLRMVVSTISRDEPKDSHDRTAAAARSARAPNADDDQPPPRRDGLAADPVAAPPCAPDRRSRMAGDAGADPPAILYL